MPQVFMCMSQCQEGFIAHRKEIGMYKYNIHVYYTYINVSCHIACMYFFLGRRPYVIQLYFMNYNRYSIMMPIF